MQVGHAAMRTPPQVTATLDTATDKKLDKRGEREVRSLMEAILAAVDKSSTLKYFSAYNNAAVKKETRKKLRGFNKL